MLVALQEEKAHGPGGADIRGQLRQILPGPDQQAGLRRPGVKAQLFDQLVEFQLHEQPPQALPVGGAGLQGLQVHLQGDGALQHRQAAAQARLLGVLF